MGPCASATDSRYKRQLPLVFPATNLPGMQFSPTLNQFQFKLSNVAVLPVRSTKIDLTFSIENIIEMGLPKTSAVVHKYLQPEPTEEAQRFELKWNQVNETQFSFNDSQLVSKYLTVKMRYENGNPFQIIRISLYQIVHGPYHHNIQIPLDVQPFRLLFDAKMSHIFETNMAVQQLKLNTISKINASSCHFIIKAMVNISVIQNDQEMIVDSQPSYPLKSGMNTLFQQNEAFYREERPKNSRIKIQYSVSMEENSNFSICWTKRDSKTLFHQNSMPSLTFDVSAHDITHYFTQVIIWSFNQRENTANYICECKIPLWKMFDKQFAENTVSTTLGDQKIHVENRKIQLNQKVYCHQEYIGTCELQIDLQNQKLIEQAKYCSRTEEGIVNMRPTAMNINVKSNSKTIHELWKYSEQIDLLFKKVLQKNNIDRYQSEISTILHNLDQKLTLSVSQILYSDSNKSEALINNQKILIEMIERLYPFIENTENPNLSELSWSIIIGILTRVEFRLQCLSLKGKYTTRQALQTLKRKRSIAMKYHQVFCRLLTFALKGYGLYHKDGSMISYFMAFAFYRVPIFRQYFFDVINYEDTYAKMQQKLIIFQTQIEPKTSFRQNFAQIKGDWKSHFYDELNDDAKAQQIFKILKESFKCKKWFKQISFKDEVLYDFISLLFETLSKYSAESSDKWKYIEGYSKIVAIIMTELKEKEVTEYNIGLIRSSIELLENQHLLTPMLPLICDKTNSHDGDKVQIVIDLIEQYLEMVTKKKTTQLPTTFNQNYFFKIMRIILQGQHYNSINKLLIVIYNYFQFFNSNGRYQIAMYLMGKVFFKLYFHWSKQIRNTFYVFLQIKIKHMNHQKIGDIMAQLIKVIGAVKIIEKIHHVRYKQTNAIAEKVLYQKLKRQVHQKMRKRQGNPGNSSSWTNSLSDYALENILKLIEDESVLQELPNIKQHSYMERTPTKLQINFTANEILQVPDKKIRTYSESVPSVEELGLGTNNQMGTSGEIKADSRQDLSLRRKRRPSVFLDTKISPISTTQYTKINNELHDLSELTDGQIKHIGYAKAQMQEVIENITKYSNEHGGELPTNEFLFLKGNQIRA